MRIGEKKLVKKFHKVLGNLEYGPVYNVEVRKNKARKGQWHRLDKQVEGNYENPQMSHILV